MLHDITIGILLGLSAGMAPGPLLALVLSETLQHGIPAGIKVALAPLVTDAPIIILTVYLLAELAAFEDLIGTISLAGGLFVFYLGYKQLRTREARGDIQETGPKSLTKGIVVNVLSPHPYLFWLSVGAPTVTRAMAKGPVAPLAFIGSFYLFLVGSKIVLAIAVGKSGAFLSGRFYIYTMRLLGLALILLGIILFRDGLKLIGLTAPYFPF